MRNAPERTCDQNVRFVGSTLQLATDVSAVGAHPVIRMMRWLQDAQGAERLSHVIWLAPVRRSRPDRQIHHARRPSYLAVIPCLPIRATLPLHLPRAMNVLNAAKPPDVLVQPGPDDSVSKLAFNPVADYLAVGSWDHQVSREGRPVDGARN